MHVSGNASNNPSIAEPLLPGSIIVSHPTPSARRAHPLSARYAQAVWNDHGPNASTPLEAFYAIKQGLPVVAAANWQAAARPNHLTHAQFLQAYPALEASAPGQNMDRRIPSKTSVVARYQLPAAAHAGAVVFDTSGNGYDATVGHDGALRTPLGSKGHNYTVLISVRPAQASGVVLSGPDNSFGFTSFGGGNTLAFNSSNIVYPLLNYTLPPASRTAAWEIILMGTENRTAAWVDGKYAGDFVIGIDGTSEFQPMAFVAPAQQIVGVEKFVLWNGLQDVAKISEGA